MRDDDKGWLKGKIQEAFLTAVRSCLNEEKAAEQASSVQRKYQGLPKDALADLLIKRAARKTMIEGAASGGAVTAAETIVAVPAPEPGQRVGAIAGIAASLTVDVAYTTRVQMQLLLEIGNVYDCPFNKDDEDDVWLIFKAALGIKGTEKAGAYARYIFTEAAEKQFRRFLRNEGRRRAAQETIRRVAGKEVAKLLSESTVLKAIWGFNMAFGAYFNLRVTRDVGKWAKVKAKIRASTFQIITRITANGFEGTLLILPTIFLAGTANRQVTDNLISLYAQARNRLCLSPAEIQEIEDIANSESLERTLTGHLKKIESSTTKRDLFDLAITAAAASSLEFHPAQHACLSRLGNTLQMDYSRQNLQQRIDWLRK
ncbi:MAG: hypothetical protein H0X34_02135 [Chthoniobacterales bacterium]|jgi:hypothetical protein|nr:hypothetical protein [Chthoniobacterales bacterium]